MTAHLLAAAATALVAAAGAWFSPRLIRALPEPDPDPENAGPAKAPYEQLAARPGIARTLAVVAAVCAGAVGWALGPDPALPMMCFLCALGVVLSYIDWHTRLLPFRLVAPAYPLMVALALLAAVLGGDWDALRRAGLAWVIVYAVFTLMWLVYRRGLGYGDVRLSGLLAIALGWLGWVHVAIGLYAAFVVGAVLGIVLAAAKVVDRRAYPFGPFLMFGTWFGVLFGSPLGAWMGWTS